YSHATPGSGDSFYTGPQVPNGTSGSLNLAGAGSQGCHTAHVRAWDNTGFSGGDSTYGPLCFDTIAPFTSASLSGSRRGSVFRPPVNVTLNASDNASGVAATFFQLDGRAVQTYAGTFAVSSLGSHSVVFHSIDIANNVEVSRSASFTIEASTSTSITSSR